MKQCKCEHWQVCPTCKPDMFDAGGKKLPARPTPLQEAKAEIERLTMGLENCRLLAARHRKEPWALLILRFCAEAGVVGSVTR
jgi:hypothetical protein